MSYARCYEYPTHLLKEKYMNDVLDVLNELEALINDYNAEVDKGNLQDFIAYQRSIYQPSCGDCAS